MKTTTYKEVTNKSGILKFKGIANSPQSLKENEYFALMVTDNENYGSPHVIGIDSEYGHFLVGIEKCSGEHGYYISKNYYKRKSRYRGQCVLVSVENENLRKCILLD